MKRLFILLLTTGTITAQTSNTLLSADFWKKNPDIATVRAEIQKGNDPTQLDANAFDPVVLAINNSASNAVVLFLMAQKGNDGTGKITHDGRTYLHWAAYKGNLEIVNHLIKKGYDVNFQDEYGATPLAFSAANGLSNASVYDRFFEAGVDLNKKYVNDATILQLGVASAKDLSLVDHLVSKGLSLNATDANGATVFDYAAKTGKLENMKGLVNKGVRPTDYAVIIAGQGARRSANPIEVFKYLVDELKLNPSALSKDDENIFHLIARKPNQDEIVTYFLSKGVDANKTDNSGNTPLIKAALEKNLGVISLLAEKTNDINFRNAKGESALTQAIRNSSAEVVSYLISKGADVNVKDKDGNNLAYYLIQSYRQDHEADFVSKMKSLQEKRLNITTPQVDGNTLYHLAVAKNDLNLLKKIEGLKIDVNAQNKEGVTALHKAALLAKDDSILKYLTSIGAKKDLKTEFDETAYQLAKENENLTKSNVSIDFLKQS